MTMHNDVAAVCIFALVATGTLACGQENPPAADPLSLIRSGKERDREQGRRQILDERTRVIGALVDIIKSPRVTTTSPRIEKEDGWLDAASSRNIAIACAGEYRAPEAISALLPLLEPAPGEIVVSSRVFGLSPAGVALVKIGKPSVSAIINLLATTDAEKMSASQAHLVLYKIEGAEIGEKMLKNAAAAEKDAARRGALEANLKKFHDQFAGY